MPQVTMHLLMPSEQSVYDVASYGTFLNTDKWTFSLRVCADCGRRKPFMLESTDGWKAVAWNDVFKNIYNTLAKKLNENGYLDNVF
jgi:hypothetical protein